jgi:microsomal dipeptidase-like Zn-dependent dipeptidase
MKVRVRLLLCALMVVGVLHAPAAQISRGTELAGIIDVHQHVGPATAQSIDRALDAIETAQIAARHGMRAIVLKQHYLETASWAYLVSRTVPGIQLFGGIALNRSVGGLNPVAVENVATFPGGVGRVVYMPTFESEHYNPGSPVAVPISRNGKLLPAVYEVLDVMAKYDLSLSTGHSSPQESLMLIQAAKEKGINKIYVQHPLLKRVGMPVEMQKKAASMGALLEYVLGEALGSDEEFKHWAEAIREVGPDNVLISSDLGQRGRPIHADGYRMVLPRLKKAGFSQAEIDIMTKRNPARFLGLEP